MLATEMQGGGGGGDSPVSDKVGQSKFPHSEFITQEHPQHVQGLRENMRCSHAKHFPYLPELVEREIKAHLFSCFCVLKRRLKNTKMQNKLLF